MEKNKRKPVIAGNWKMNNGPAAAGGLLDALLSAIPAQPVCEVVVCVPFLDIPLAAEKLKGSSIALGAQNCHFAASGAYTGEISAPMLAETGCSHVIIGHSERRQYFGETDETAGQRLKAAVEAGLTAILCVGENLTERDAGQELEKCTAQLTAGLAGVTEQELERVLVAYEPVWAIGTGRTATAEEAARVCGALRQAVAEQYGAPAAQKLRILYGGSMNEKNARELLAQPDIDGGLIGGASLKAGSFGAIVDACQD